MSEIGLTQYQISVKPACMKKKHPKTTWFLGNYSKNQLQLLIWKIR
jgi:hypothetical protein